MSTMASNPVDQIIGSVGMPWPVKWADLIDDDGDVSGGAAVSAEVESKAETGPEMTSLTEALDDIRLADSAQKGEEVLQTRAEAEPTAAKGKAADVADPAHTPSLSLTEVNGSVSESERSSSPPCSSDTSSCYDELPSSLEPRKRHCIGPGVFSLCETLKQVKVGRIEPPTIYYHGKDDSGRYLEDPIPVQAVGDVPRLPLPAARAASSSSRPGVKKTEPVYKSPMKAALARPPFQPRDAEGHGSQWHDPSTYRSADQHQHQQRHQANYAPFYSNRKRAALRAQMEAQRQWQTRPQNQVPMRNNAEQWQPHPQWQGHGQAQYPPRQQHFEMPPPMPPSQRLPPRASLHGLLPPPNYDVPVQSYERGPAQRQYDPAPHQSHWRGNPYERSETPLTWGAGRGAEPSAVMSGHNDRYPVHSDVADVRPPPETWRGDVQLVKRGILNRNQM